jgi:hypothetical protein
MPEKVKLSRCKREEKLKKMSNLMGDTLEIDSADGVAH